MKGKSRILIAITGTPAAGKSTLARRIAKVAYCPIIEINDMVKKKKLFSSKDKYKTKIVRLAPLSSEIKEVLSKYNGPILIVGHLAQELDIKFDIAIVVRAPLKVLLARMKKRKYPMEKIRENIISEAVDYCGSKMLRRAKEIYEVSTGKEKQRIIKYIVNISKSLACKKPTTKYVERVGELESLRVGGLRF